MYTNQTERIAQIDADERELQKAKELEMKNKKPLIRRRLDARTIVYSTNADRIAQFEKQNGNIKTK